MINIILRSMFLISFFMLFLNSCEDTGPQNNVPPCIDETITQNPPICYKPGSVDEYFFQNEKVYVFNFSVCCCDYASPVLSSTCDTLGQLDGVGGNHFIQGEDFYDAIFLRRVWP